MKKLKITIALFTVMMLLMACGADSGKETPAETPAEVPQEEPAEEPAESPAEGEAEENEQEPEAEEPAEDVKEYTVEMLYPFESDTHRVYEGKGNEYAAYDVYVDFMQEDRIQLRENNGGTEIVRVLEKKEGMLKEIIFEPETYYKENFLSKEANTDRILLMEPVAEGTTWKSGEETSTITAVEKEVETPYGTFDAVEVTRVTKTDNGEYTNIDYYAENLGLIKTLNIGEGYEVSSSLEKIEKDTAQRKVVNFYYPNAMDERIFLYRKEIAFTTNDIPRMLLIEAYKDLPKEAAPVLTPNTRVNYLYLNQDGMVYVDLSKEFLTEMNAGAGYESLILQSLANTFGDYYGTSKVLLTIDGETYESGHILLREFEPLEVNYDSIVDMN
ncbi:GerMN domain-containing protein [Proteiniclasticum sp. C24MP]|uniref:GerMN domain-containing protein n=1 Tax=Proteiniclasticum sp. C24MP TaxID=3374101 RepID=UPI0037542412